MPSGFFDDVIGNAGKVVATRIPGNRVGHADVEVELAEADFESPGQLVELVAHAEQKWRRVKNTISAFNA